MLMMREKCLAVEVFTWTLIVLLAVEAARGSSTPPPTAPSTTLTPQQERTGRQWNLNLAEADYIAIATFHKIAGQDMWKNLLEQTMPSSLVGEVIENFKTKYDFTGNVLLDSLVPPVNILQIRDKIKQESRMMNATVDLMGPETKRWKKNDVYALFCQTLFASHVAESLGLGVGGKTEVSTDEIKSLINNRLSSPVETGTARPRAGSDEATSNHQKKRRVGSSRHPQQ